MHFSNQQLHSISIHLRSVLELTSFGNGNGLRKSDVSTPAKLPCVLVVLILATPIGSTREFQREPGRSRSAATATRVFELRHGVVIDAARGAVYVGEPKRGIDAVDLSTGRSLWRSAEAALPLALHGQLLAAQEEEAQPGPRLRIAVLDVEDGGRKVIDSAAALPADARALVADQLGRSFRATAESDGNGFLISWSYKETLVQGIARPPGEPPPTLVLSGAIRIGLDGCAATTDAAAARPQPNADQMAERLMKSEGLPNPPWRAGSVLAITVGGRGGPLTLKRWDARTGQALPGLVLLKQALVALASTDKTHVLASERVGAGGPGDPEYRWSIFSIETGEKVGELRRDVSAAPFFVWRDIVIFESQPHGYRNGDTWVDEPLKIIAIRCSTGESVWDRAVRGVEYRGPTPPAL
jgi:hypothetical protein